MPSNRFGPGVSLAHQLADFWPDDTIGIIKVASGGSGVRAFEKNWSFERAERTFDGKKGSFYKDLMHLSQKGLLESTLVVVSTEFGRKPDVNPNRGRDHHPDGFTCLMAGAGVKAGQIYGTTSSDGKHAEENILDVTDFNATIAWRLGIDPAFEEHTPNGRPFKLANRGEARKELFS